LFVIKLEIGSLICLFVSNVTEFKTIFLRIEAE